MKNRDAWITKNVSVLCLALVLASCATARTDDREKSVLIRLLEVQDCSATDDEIREVAKGLGLSERRLLAEKRAMIDSGEAVTALGGDLLVYISGTCDASSIATGNIDDHISLAVTQSYIRQLDEQ